MSTRWSTGTGVDITLDTWNEIEFDTPYHVSGDENLLVGYEFHGSGNALGIDDGPTVTNKGDWANFGNGWTTLQTAASGFNYNNLIHTYCENLFVTTGQKAPALAESQSVISDAKDTVAFTHYNRAVCAKDAKTYLDIIKKMSTPEIPLICLGPVPFDVEMVNKNYRWRLSIKCRNNQRFRDFLNGVTERYLKDKNNKSSVYINVNPIDRIKEK